jgi:hypothetical protein
MQVSVRRAAGATPEDSTLAIVAFEFGVVRDPHEFLQDEARTRVWEVSHANKEVVARELRVSLMDKHRGLLGRRGNLWMSAHDHALLRVLTGFDPPWEEKQVMCPSTMLWIAKRVPAIHFRVPAATSLAATPGNALHEAVMQATLLQAAFRAFELNKDFRAAIRKSPRDK